MFIYDREATENVGYLIKQVAGGIIILGALLYLFIYIKPTYEQIKEIVIYVAIYLMGYGTKEVVKKNGK